MAELSIFIGALVIAYVVPGPDMLVLLQTGARHGRRHAFATAVGLAAARAAHVVLAALGLAALLRAAPWAFHLVRLAGAAYLVWLAISILRAPPGALQPHAGGAPVRGSYAAAFSRGLLTNLLNPKALLFCSVLLPQFIGPGDPWPQFLLLGVILVGLGFAFDLAFALAGATVVAWIARTPRAEAIQRWVFASLLAAFGVRLALLQRLA